MDPGSGRLYDESEIPTLSPAVRSRIVRVSGPKESIEAIARHVERGTRKDRRKAARKAQRVARRNNR